MSALRGIRIVELAESVAGEYCGKLLSDFEAEVIKVERPGGGSPTRAIGPMADCPDSSRVSSLFAYLNTNKKSVTLDLAAAGDRAVLDKLVATADVVIDDHPEGWLEALGLGPGEGERRHPRVVVCSITPFGRGAPGDWGSARALNVFHASGWGYHTPTQPDPARPPLKGAGRFMPDYEAGLDAALCIAAALVWRDRSGQGQVIDVCAREVLVSRADGVLGRMLPGEDEPSTARDAYDMKGPAQAFACQDGYVYLMILHSGHWGALRKLMGGPGWMDDFPDNWLEFGVNEARVAKFRAHFGEWIRERKKDDVSAEAQKLGIALVPVNDASDLRRSPQYAFRGFFQELVHPDLGPVLYPTAPYKLSATPVKLVSAAPRLGEHGPAVLGAGA